MATCLHFPTITILLGMSRTMFQIHKGALLGLRHKTRYTSFCLLNNFTEMMTGPGRMTFSLGWVVLWLFGREQTKAFNLSDCSIKNTIWTYSSMKEEEFVLFCDLKNCNANENHSVQWYLQPLNGEPLSDLSKNYPHIIQKDTTLHFLTIGMNDSGLYICRPTMRRPQDKACCISTVLEVKNKTSETCMNTVSHKQDLVIGKFGSIYCPCVSNRRDAKISNMTWYQNGRHIFTQTVNPFSDEYIFDEHEGMYTCDHTQSDNATSWIVRAVVQVRTIVKDTQHKPNILDPIGETLDVELGKPLTLNCTVQFDFQKDFKPILKWYIKDSDQEVEETTSETRSVLSTKEFDRIKRTVFLKEVTQSDLHKKFICFAQNSIGNVTRSIQLKAKKGVVFIYILLSTTMGLAGVFMTCAFLYIYWIEIMLLYRTYQNKDETVGDEKEFDAFISYAKWNSLESEASSSLSEEHLAVNLFPEVLENKYGYTLCLLERDVAPGGAYAEDIVNIIKKSRRGIFILSPKYINGPGIFELQAAANLALNDQTIKLILIKFCPLKEPVVVPHLVKKALKVLPAVTWRGSKSVPPNSRFWTQMRYHMPVKRSKNSRGTQRYSWSSLLEKTQQHRHH
ncbi:interleukin-18 receptor accessory protein [Sorex fumeus]|uniref:interleukin-18 receptor accessory protein n=1 Tax=Sorex fumeus TaxID=62283 RepID=UPI0024AD617C|nr:interleukin-18 receptor accessory protein [Sorex fumeus]